MKPIPRFNDHGATCKGHSNFMLDCDMTRQEDRYVMIKVLDRYMAEYDKELGITE